jgi:hypothetical protein
LSDFALPYGSKKGFSCEFTNGLFPLPSHEFQVSAWTILVKISGPKSRVADGNVGLSSLLLLARGNPDGAPLDLRPPTHFRVVDLTFFALEQ